MKVELALRRLGFSGEEIAGMSGAEADAWLEAYNEVVNTGEKDGPLKYRVRRGPGNSLKGRRQ